MKNKETYLLRGTFALVIFVCMGYVIKFYPETVLSFDQTVQAKFRSDLPSFWTDFFQNITVLGNPPVQLALTIFPALVFWLKKWRAEAYYLLTSASLAGLAIVVFKSVYQRPRPSIPHLVSASGYSFPSGHALGIMAILGVILIVCYQRLNQRSGLRLIVSLVLTSLIVLVALSRVYLGVHYPIDILAGLLVGYAILNMLFPYYDRWRFKWRFQAKQK
ncbi:phosphatase PAP2 family protein [Streptococcus sp. sy010]|uniref:phosphatase PAP2 family protein n=1 Tax=Streptococcus sp. sy010 TaxID=2600148 RepID=UPI0011B50323|nr:phosphatase PAP2 family protein [Streptococcus sp. sy010]TWT14236.1 phosphatase PAP2 family protein [Streptococcus sp. sy010]